MQRSPVSLFVSILVIIGLLSGAAYYFSTEQEKQMPPVVQDPNGSDAKTQGDGQSVTAQHRFEDEMHTVYGRVNVPTPCHKLDHMLVIRESYPEQVTIELTAVAEDGVICAQVITPKEFTVEFDAAEAALITATLNGEPAVLNLIQIEPGEPFGEFDVLDQ